MAELNINKENFKELKKIYKLAVDTGLETFFFQEKEILTAYAKYMIEYLETQIKKIVVAKIVICFQNVTMIFCDKASRLCNKPFHTCGVITAIAEGFVVITLCARKGL